MIVDIVQTGSKISVKCPKHPAFIRFIKGLRGQWDAALKAWIVDGRDLDRVRAECRRIYGTAGEDVPLVDVRCDVGYIYDNPWHDLGRLIAERYSRDSTVKLGDGVVILSGGFSDSGGSVKNPSIKPLDGTVLEIRDVPLPIAQEYIDKEGFSIVNPVGANLRVDAINQIRAMMEEHDIRISEIFP